MDLPKLTIYDFRNIESFQKLQRNFLEQDFHYQQDVPYPKINYKEDFYIVYPEYYCVQSGRDYIDEYTTEKYYFYKNYLKQALKSLSSDYIVEFYSELREDYMDNVKQRKNHILKKRTEVRNIFDNLNQFDFLEKEIYNELHAQLFEIERVVSNDALTNEKEYKIDKIALKNWNRTDLITLFYYLRQEGAIEDVSDIKLGNFIEKNFCVEEEGEVETLLRINKKLSGVKTGVNPVKKAIKRLQDFFSKIDIESQD